MPVIFKPDEAGAYLSLPHEAASSMCVTLDDSVRMRTEVVVLNKPETAKKSGQPEKKKPEEPLSLFD